MKERGRERGLVRDLSRREFLERGACVGASLGMFGVGTTHALVAALTSSGDTITLQNGAIAAVWSVKDGTLRARELFDRVTRVRFPLPDAAFHVTLADGVR